MYVSIDVTKPKGKGASDFFAVLPMLLKDATTWKLAEGGPLSAVIESTATMTAVPKPPRYRLREEFAGSVTAELLEADEWTREQKIVALGSLIYLCFVALGSHVRGVRLEG